MNKNNPLDNAVPLRDDYAIVTLIDAVDNVTDAGEIIAKLYEIWLIDRALLDVIFIRFRNPFATYREIGDRIGCKKSKVGDLIALLRADHPEIYDFVARAKHGYETRLSNEDG